MDSTGSYKSPDVWRKGLVLAREIYDLTGQFPAHEQLGLISQMQRASVSIPSNIAEGSRRRTKKDFRRFVLIAYGSASELETQLELIKILPFGKQINLSKADSLLYDVIRMLNRLQQSLRTDTERW